MADIKLSANLSEAVVNARKDIAGKRGISMTEALSQAISREKFFVDAIASHKKILLKDPHSDRLNEVLI